MQTEPSEAAIEKPKALRKSSGNVRIAAILALFAVFMIGLSFAAVPLYRVFCARTGYAGTPQRATANSTNVTNEIVRVRFDANVSPGLKWSFQPVEREVSLKIGENKLALFRATNLSNETLTGTATFNVTPQIMGAYFTKIQCFCFTAQTLKPGQTAELPVSFFVDPAMLKDPDAKDFRDISLSYTFFKTHNPAEVSPSFSDKTEAAPKVGTSNTPAGSTGRNRG